MKRYIFKYTPEPTKTGIIHRPTARIFLQSTQNEWYAFRVYIDSGADMSLFTKTDAKLLGLDFYKGEYRPIIGIGKTNPRLHPQNQNENRRNNPKRQHILRRLRRSPAAPRQNRHL